MVGILEGYIKILGKYEGYNTIPGIIPKCELKKINFQLYFMNIALIKRI